MKCEKCSFTHEHIIVEITDAVKTIHLCPNCVAVSFLGNELSFINHPDFVDDVTGKHGAVRYVCGDEEYFLERRAMMRLISHNLRKNEYLVLAKKYGSHKYMLHEDFYLEDGTAWQPMR